jgi:hypothetical protein
MVSSDLKSDNILAYGGFLELVTTFVNENFMGPAGLPSPDQTKKLGEPVFPGDHDISKRDLLDVVESWENLKQSYLNNLKVVPLRQRTDKGQAHSNTKHSTATDKLKVGDQVQYNGETTASARSGDVGTIALIDADSGNLTIAVTHQKTDKVPKPWIVLDVDPKGWLLYGKGK